MLRCSGKNEVSSGFCLWKSRTKYGRINHEVKRMIRHIVMWKFREGTETRAEEFLTGLAALQGKIGCIRSMTVERSAVKDSAYDAVLISEFDSLEDVAAYKNDPRHRAVAAICAEIRTARCAIDTEI